MRLIDADKEIEFYKGILYNPTPDVTESDRWLTHAIINAFERASTVESRPKGEWIDKHASHYECSNCGEWVDKSQAWRYCTHCGSDNRKIKRGEKEGEKKR